MSRLFTVGDLVERCKQRADMENSSFIKDPEWKQYLSTVYGEFYSLVALPGVRHFEDVSSFATNGSAAYALPTDFLSLVGVDYVVDNAGHRRQLKEQMAPERNRFKGLTNGGEAVEYALVGSGATPLELYPTPPSGQTYEIRYIPQPADIAKLLDGAEIDVVTPDGEAFLLYGVAAIALAKEKTERDFEVGERERMRARIVEWAALRSFNNASRRIMVEDELGPARGGEYRYGEYGEF